MSRELHVCVTPQVLADEFGRDDYEAALQRFAAQMMREHGRPDQDEVVVHVGRMDDIPSGVGDAGITMTFRPVRVASFRFSDLAGLTP